MSYPRILDESQSYTFRSYFELSHDTDQILAELGYGYGSQRLHLPQSRQSSDRLPALKQQIEEVLPLVILSTETAKREMLVAPVLTEVARLCRCQIRIEYSLAVNNWLKGELDYLLRSKNQLIVIEAKKDDLTRGFTQLAVELIALAQVEEQSCLYGAVTIGNAWNFGYLDRSDRKITQDITLYRVPDDLEQLIAILVGILQGVSDQPIG
jgi:hypothetical protein